MALSVKTVFGKSGGTQINISSTLPESPSESVTSEASGVLPNTPTKMSTADGIDGPKRPVVQTRFREEFKRRNSFKLWIKKLVN